MGRRLEFLDSLRGLAAVYVIVYHTALIPNPALSIPDWAAPVVLSGGTGVTLFFVASAFSLCRAMRSHGDEPHPLTAFVVRRLFRIAPLFYTMIAFYLVRDAWYFGLRHSAAEVAASALFVFDFWPGHETGIVWASWTIGVEMPFYALFPLLAARSRDPARAVALVFGTLLAAAMFHEILRWTPLSPALQDTYYKSSFLRHLPIFAFGILAYRLFERFIEERTPSRGVGGALLLGGLYTYYALLRGSLSQGFTDPYYWQGVTYSMILLALAIHPNAVLVNRASLYLGRISYSLYLVHPSVILFMSPLYRWVEAQGLPVTLSFGACATATLAAVTAISALTYRYVERPGTHFGKHVLARLGASASSSVFIPR